MGADIYHGPRLNLGYGVTISDGQTFEISGLKITVIHTPVHTIESISYAVIDLDTGKETIMVFTGVTLFVNDVGRIILYEANNAPNHQIQIASM